jgi:PAS domain S-box-containing protein
MLAISIVSLSFLFQLGAAYFAVRLIRITGYRSAWSLVALASMIQAIRRAVVIYHVLMPGGETFVVDFPIEIIGLTISFCLLLGLAIAGPLFRGSQRSLQAIRESEAKYRTLMERSSDAIFILDKAGTCSEANPKAAGLLGCSSVELSAVNLLELMLRPGGGKTLPSLSEIRRGSTTMFETRLGGKNGAVADVEMVVTRLEDDNYLVTAHDIAEQKQALESLRRSAELYDRFTSATSDHIYLKDDKFRHLIVNEAAAEFIGKPRAEILGKTMFELVAESVATKCHESDMKALASGEISISEEKIGSQVFEVYKFPVLLPDGTSGLGGYGKDVTTRVQAEQAVRESQRTLSTLMSNLPGMAYRCRNDEDRTLEFASEGCFALTGYRPEELVGSKVSSYGELIHHDDQILVRESVQAALQTAEAFMLQYRIRTAAGEERWVWEQGRGVFSADGTLEAIEGFIADTTERIAAETALRESEERFRTLSNRVPVGIFQSDARGNTQYVNDRWLQITGLSREIATGSMWTGPIHPEEAHQVREAWHEAIGKGRDFSIEYKLLADDGRVARILGQAVPIRDYEGAVAGHLGTIWDLTDRERAYEALRYRERFEKLIAAISSSFINLSPDETDEAIVGSMGSIGEFAKADRCYLYLISDAEGKWATRTHEWNSPGVQVVSLPPTLERRQFAYFTDRALETGGVYVPRVDDLPAEAEPGKSSLLKAGVKSGIVVPLVYNRETLGWFGIEAIADYREWPEDTVALLRIVGEIFSNAIEHRRANAVLQQSEEQYRQLVELSPDGIFVPSADERFAYVNAAFVRMMGADCSSDLLGAPILDRVQENARDAVRARLEDLRCREQRVPLRQEQFLRLDGTPIDVEITAVRFTMNGRPSAQVIVRDISERERIEKERKILEAQLRRSQKLETIGTLAAGIAHDFNNLLVPVINYTELALADLPPDHPTTENLVEVLKAGSRARDLVAQIMAFSRQKDGERRPINLAVIVREVSKLLASTLPPNVRVRTWCAETTLPVLADATQMHQVLMNLAVNAGHAMADGGTLSISLDDVPPSDGVCATCEMSISGKQVHLMVQDTGCGMDKAVLQRIFDPFFTTKEAGEGSGLGLAVTQGIVLHHNGHICVSSEPGVGTTFHIYLPAVESSIVERDSGAEIARGGSESIMIVDSNMEATDAVATSLERIGYRVTRVYSSINALGLFHAQPQDYDIVLIDQMMPELSGDKLAEELILRRSDVPVILFAGYGGAASPVGSLPTGRIEVLTKPVPLAELDRRIRAAVGTKAGTPA